MKNNLIGARVDIFCIGGWSVSGIVIDQIDDKIFLKEQRSSDEGVFIIFKNKVSMVKIYKEKTGGGNKNIKQNKNTIDESNYPENKLSYYESHMSFPFSLSNKNNEDDDFSVFFGDDKSKKKSNIEFKSKDEDDK